jgi:hypothetical protein
MFRNMISVGSGTQRFTSRLLMLGLAREACARESFASAASEHAQGYRTLAPTRCESLRNKQTSDCSSEDQ